MDPARAWSRAQPRPEETNAHIFWALGKVEHGLLEVTLKRGSGISRQELTWQGGGVNLVRPQGLKIRRAVVLPQGVLSVDRYLAPEILIFEIPPRPRFRVRERHHLAHAQDRLGGGGEVGVADDVEVERGQLDQSEGHLPLAFVLRVHRR